MSSNAHTEKIILIEHAAYETRVAELVGGVLQELQVERREASNLIGNIYKGKVQRVVPGLQAAFVDIGVEKNGFLGIKEFRRTVGSAASKVKTSGKDKTETLKIEALLSVGQYVWVQVSKEPFADKGARLSTELTLPSKTLIYLPNGSEIGVTHKISCQQERSRLIEGLQNIVCTEKGQGGFIIRTSAEGVPLEQIKKDFLFLQKQWAQITNKMQSATSVSLVHQELPLTKRVLRDLQGDEQVYLNSQAASNDAKQFLAGSISQSNITIEYQKHDSSLFEHYDVERQIDLALQKHVPLPSGGSLIIEQTTALTVVDVNSGSNVSKRRVESANNHHGEQTILNTNLEACQALSRQLRLRNIAGIIIVDFIDMQDQQDREQLVESLRVSLKSDPVHTTIGKLTPLGLLEISRQRSGSSLQEVLSAPCLRCAGQGVVKNVETICFELFRDIGKQHQEFKAGAYTVSSSTEVVNFIREHHQASLNQLQKEVGRSINLIIDSAFDLKQSANDGAESYSVGSRQYNIALTCA